MKKKNYRLELTENIHNLLVVIQNQILKEAGSKPSFRLIILYYFNKGLNVNLKLKTSIVQKSANNAHDLISIESSFASLDQCLDQYITMEEQKLDGLDGKDRLLQRDLMDQFNILRNKELRLTKEEANFTKRYEKSSNSEHKAHQMELTNLQLQGEVSKHIQKIQLYELQDANNKERIKQLTKEREEQSVTLNTMQRDISKILKQTYILVKDKESLFNKIVPLLTPLAAYLGSKAGAKGLLENKPEE